MLHQTADESPLRGNLHMPRPGYPEVVQKDVPRLLVGQNRILASGQLGQYLFRQSAIGHIGQRIDIEHVILVAGAQNLQKIYPALAFVAFEIREPFVADVGAVAVFAVVPRPGVVDVDMARGLQVRRQDILLFGMERFLSLRR